MYPKQEKKGFFAIRPHLFTATTCYNNKILVQLNYSEY